MGFKLLDGDSAVVRVNGTFKETALYSWGGMLFVEISKGSFVRLNKDGSTSKSKMQLVSLVTDRPLLADKFGRLCVDKSDGRMVLDPAQTQKLLAVDA